MEQYCSAVYTVGVLAGAAVMDQTARVISHLGGKDQSSKEFQNLIRQIGEAKTKHVSVCVDTSTHGMHTSLLPSLLPSLPHS